MNLMSVNLFFENYYKSIISWSEIKGSQNDFSIMSIGLVFLITNKWLFDKIQPINLDPRKYGLSLPTPLAINRSMCRQELEEFIASYNIYKDSDRLSNHSYEEFFTANPVMYEIFLLIRDVFLNTNKIEQIITNSIQENFIKNCEYLFSEDTNKSHITILISKLYELSLNKMIISILKKYNDYWELLVVKNRLHKYVKKLLITRLKQIPNDPYNYRNHIIFALRGFAEFIPINKNANLNKSLFETNAWTTMINTTSIFKYDIYSDIYDIFLSFDTNLYDHITYSRIESFVMSTDPTDELLTNNGTNEDVDNYDTKVVINNDTKIVINKDKRIRKTTVASTNASTDAKVSTNASTNITNTPRPNKLTRARWIENYRK